MKRALFPGSFDPITIAHMDIIGRSAKLFDEVIVATAKNDSKKCYIKIEDRVSMLAMACKAFENVKVLSYDELTINFCKKIACQFMIRGIRTVTDFEYEKAIAQMNYTLDDSIESVFIVSKPNYSSISSTLVREVMKNGGNVQAFTPKAIQSVLAPYIHYKDI